MSDLISRQAALETQAKYAEYIGATKFWQMRDDIRALPSAQPSVSKTETVEDCISRQAAIDATWSEPSYTDPLNVLTEVRDRLKALPSAQPEQKKGMWIPVDSYSAFGGDEATWMAHGNPVAFYYCSECKEEAYAGEDGEPLLTDYCPNCGADMRGEQDG